MYDNEMMAYETATIIEVNFHPKPHFLARQSGRNSINIVPHSQPEASLIDLTLPATIPTVTNILNI